jgi:hypothetical protein
VALWVGRVSAGSCLLKPLPLHRWSCCRGDDHALTPYALPRRPLHHSWLWPTGGQMTERRGARGWGWYHKALADQANPAVAVEFPTPEDGASRTRAYFDVTMEETNKTNRIVFELAVSGLQTLVA